MKNTPKKITKLLLDGTADGSKTCEISNWTGKAFQIPRRKIKDFSNREELKSTAVYFLFGKSDILTSKPKIYIGEAENVYDRLSQHIEKDFWNETVAFISKDKNLNKAHIKYLESRFYEIAIETNNYDVQNKIHPTKSSISEADQAEMEEFIEYVRLLINDMGFKVFETIIKKEEIKIYNTEIKKLFVKNSRGANAIGNCNSEGFVVLKDSEIAIKITNSLPKGGANLRNKLIEDGIIIKNKNKLMFISDYLFNSCSAAATVILGMSANGLTEWKDNTGKTLKDIEINGIK